MQVNSQVSASHSSLWALTFGPTVLQTSLRAHTHAINVCEAYYRQARGQLRTRDPPSCSCPERSNLHLRRARKCTSGGSKAPCSAGWWPRTVRLGEVMAHARVLLRLRGRKERDHHEQGSIQHRAVYIREFPTYYPLEKKHHSTKRGTMGTGTL